MSDMAKPCPECNQYYPGDCFHRGCKDEHCNCDGCIIHFMIEDDED